MKKNRLLSLFLALVMMISASALFCPDARAAKSVSGTVYTSSLSTDDTLTLTGDTTLIVDKDRTLKSIDGDFALTVSGSKELTIRNGISAGSVNISAKVNAYAVGSAIWARIGSVMFTNAVVDIESSGGYGVHASRDIVISGGSITINTYNCALRSESGDIRINGNLNATCTDDASCISALGDVIIEGGIVSITSSSSTSNMASILSERQNIRISGGTVTAKGSMWGIHAKIGSVYLSSNVNISSRGYGVYANNDIEISGENTIINSTRHSFYSNYGDLRINGNLDAYAQNTSCMYNSRKVIIEGGVVSLISRNGEAGIESKGPVTIGSGITSVTASGSKTAIRGNTINLSSNLLIQEPTGGKVGKISGSDDNSDNIISGYKAALHTVIVPGPLTGTVTVSPSNPTPNSTVTSVLSGELQNIPADKLHYQWQFSRLNSTSFTDISGETGATMEIGADINPGYKFRLAVWADGYSGSVISNIVTVSETLTGTATISPSSPKPGETMTVALGGVLASIPADKLHYQWQSSSRAGVQLIDITGATGATYTVPADATSSYSYRVVITADGYDGSITSATVMLGGPALTGQVTITPSNPKVGDTLDASVRITTPGYSGRTLYQWQRSVDAGSSVFEDIPLATGSTYIPVQEDAGKQIRLSVSAGGYDGSIVSAPVTVAEDKTLSGTVTISPSNPAAGTTLTSTRSGGVADISVRDLNYQWQSKSNGRTFTNIRLATGSTYTIPESAADGTQYRLMVTADGYTGTLYSNTVTVGGSSYQKGDVNRDGSVSNSDLILVARHVVNLITLTGEQFTLGDMNDDKQITNTDIITVARKIVGL